MPQFFTDDAPLSDQASSQGEGALDGVDHPILVAEHMLVRETKDEESVCDKGVVAPGVPLELAPVAVKQEAVGFQQHAGDRIPKVHLREYFAVGRPGGVLRLEEDEARWTSKARSADSSGE